MRLLPVSDSAPQNSGPASVAEAAAMTPAVIIGASAEGLGIARCLGKAGVPVVLVDDDAGRPGMHSRYARPSVVSAMSGPALIEDLLAVRACLDHRPVLFPTSDPQVHTISEHRERLAEAFHIRLPEHHCVCELLHKRSFQRLAESHGFAVPRAISVCHEKDFVNFAPIRFPVVIKPGNKQLFYSQKAPRAVTVSSREQAEALCRAVLP